MLPEISRTTSPETSPRLCPLPTGNDPQVYWTLRSLRHLPTVRNSKILRGRNICYFVHCKYHVSGGRPFQTKYSSNVLRIFQR